MKLGDVATDIILSGIAKQVQFGLVGPEDDAFAADDMKPDRAVLEEILSSSCLRWASSWAAFWAVISWKQFIAPWTAPF